MTRAGLLAVAAVGAVGLGVALSRTPAVRRFVTTVREAAAEREAELRRAVEVAVTADATVRAPRHAADPRLPDLDVDAGWDTDRGRRRGAAAALGDDDPGRSLTPEQAHDLLLDPTGPGAGRRAR